MMPVIAVVGHRDRWLMSAVKRETERYEMAGVNKVILVGKFGCGSGGASAAVG